MNNTKRIIENIKSRGYWIINLEDGTRRWVTPEEILNQEKIMPAKPWYVRLWRKFFPLKGIEVPADGIMREFKLK